jgi:glycerate 2-kinase
LNPRPAALSEEAAQARAAIAGIFNAAISAVEGEWLVRSRSSFDGAAWSYSCAGQRFRWPLPRRGRVLVVGAGKAAANLAAGLETVLGGRIDGGCVIVKEGHGRPLERVQVFEASHPVPGAAGVAATEALLKAVEGLGPDDRVFVPLTGGASALLVAPAAGLTLEDKARTTQLLLRCGAAIDEINTVRTSLSRIKGGGLRTAIGPAASMTLLISDIPGGDPAMIGSGPTLGAGGDPAASLAILERYGVAAEAPPRVIDHLRAGRKSAAHAGRGLGAAHHLVLADSAAATAAAAADARARGYAVVITEPQMQGDTHAAALDFAQAMRDGAAARRTGGPPTVLLAAGETTLKLHGRGRGGRNQEFALVAAGAVAGVAGVQILAAGTDGTDGPTQAAGAFADGETLRRGGGPAALEAALADNDSNSFFAAEGGLFVTGVTGTNVMDLVIGLVV